MLNVEFGFSRLRLPSSAKRAVCLVAEHGVELYVSSKSANLDDHLRGLL
jgi:hypothetical protein